ncbi:MAG TPA: class I poly(R)-hydroxyalkanoic acid synthase [Archangium sp.]
MTAPQTTGPSPVPNPNEVMHLMGEITARSTRLFVPTVKKQAQQAFSVAKDEFGIARAFFELWGKLMLDPVRVAQAQLDLVGEYTKLWQNSWKRAFGLPADEVAATAKGDNRFRDDDWKSQVLFDFIRQAYLLTAKHLLGLAHTEGLSPEAEKKVTFFTRQFVEGLSPGNFAATNPGVIRETWNTGGMNLLRGFNHFLADLEAGGGELRISMTDTSAFKVGVNVATTPGRVVAQSDLAQLIQFEPTTEKVHKRPLLIATPWINKYYILDLRESNSFIRWATQQGHTVFVLSWVNPDERLAQKGFEDYMTEGFLMALDAIEKITGEKQVNAIGYCLGGTLLGSTLGYLAAHNDDRIASATFLVSLLDFSQPGELGVFIDEAQVTNLEKRMNERGFLEGSEMGNTFNLMRASDLVWSFYVNNYLMGREAKPFDLLYWNSDATRMPAKMHSFYLRNMYIKNLLRQPGGITLEGTPIDLSKVKVPAYFISCAEDHIAPWKTTYLGSTALGGPVRFVLGGSGHIAGVVNPPSANKYGYLTNDAHPSSPDAWQAGAKKNEGSWWTDWNAWVTKDAPEQVPARKPDPKLESAPGSYVAARI